MAYKVTLIEGKNDIEFEFALMSDASYFIDMALDRHKVRETDEGRKELIVLVEATKKSLTEIPEEDF